MSKKKYHKSSLWTSADDFIEELAEWLNQNYSADKSIEVNISIDNGKIRYKCSKGR